MSTAPMMEQEVMLTDEDRSGIADLVRSILKEETVSRRREVRTAWEQRAFRNGDQQLFYDEKNYCWTQPEASGMDLPTYRDSYNIYTPHWRSFVSLLSQNPPGINFVPNDLQVALDVTAAAYGEKMRHRVDRLLNMKDRQGEIAGYFCTDGRTIARTYVDAESVLRCTIHGVLESKVPIFVRKMERWGYCVLSEEADKYEAQAEWPDFADKIDGSDDSAESNYERMARMNVIAKDRGYLGGYAETFKNLITRHVAWIRPFRYRKAPQDLRDKLNEMFPSGLRATVIAGTTVEAVEERMEDALAVSWPAPGQGQNRRSMLHDLVPVQKAYNDYKNHLRDQADYIDPILCVDGGAIDSEALPEQVSVPDGTMVFTVPAGGSIQAVAQRLDSNGMSQELMQACTDLAAFAEFTTGDLPSLQGAGDAHSETASGQKMLSDQAKGQLSNAWGAMQWVFADIYSIAVPLAAKMAGNTPIAIQGNGGSESFDPSAILDGKFGAYPNNDSSFPETSADKRAALASVSQDLAAAGPDGLTILMQPDNLKLRSQYSGLPDLIIPGAEARDKQLEEIEQLLKETPVPDQAKMAAWMETAVQATQQGQQPPPMPLIASIGVKPRDYHADEVAKCNEWLSSPACREELRKGNQAGVQNVELHADLHDQAIAAKAAANAPPPQFKPPNVSLTGTIADPVAIAAILKADGIATTPENVQASQLPEIQNTVAKTQHSAAQAQHQSVLAAKEAVAPVKAIPSPQAPDQETK